jgi:hypothetical protein
MVEAKYEITAQAANGQRLVARVALRGSGADGSGRTALPVTTIYQWRPED